MRTVSTIAQFLLGAIFLVFGLNGFFHFIHMPPPEGVAAQFFGAIFASGFWVVVFSLQVIPAILLLINRFVPLALTLLGPLVVNIFCVHAFMAPSGLPIAIVVVILWFLVYHQVRAAFAGLYQQRQES